MDPTLTYYSSLAPPQDVFIAVTQFLEDFRGCADPRWERRSRRERRLAKLGYRPQCLQPSGGLMLHLNQQPLARTWGSSINSSTNRSGPAGMLCCSNSASHSPEVFWRNTASARFNSE